MIFLFYFYFLCFKCGSLLPGSLSQDKWVSQLGGFHGPGGMWTGRFVLSSVNGALLEAATPWMGLPRFLWRVEGELREGAGSGQGIGRVQSRDMRSARVRVSHHNGADEEASFGWESSVCKILHILFENTVSCHWTSLETPAQPLCLHIYAKQNANEPIESFVSALPRWELGSPD